MMLVMLDLITQEGRCASQVEQFPQEGQVQPIQVLPQEAFLVFIAAKNFPDQHAFRAEGVHQGAQFFCQLEDFGLVETVFPILEETCFIIFR